MSQRILYPVGDTKVRNHIYQPTMLPADLATFVIAQGWPAPVSARWGVGLTLEQMMAIAWRVNLWTLTGDLAFSWAGGTMSGPVTGNSIAPFAVTERDVLNTFYDGMGGSPPTRIGPPGLGNTGFLVLSGGGTCTYFNGFALYDIGHYEGSIIFLIDQFTNLQITAYDPDTELFYPPIDVNLGAFPFSIDHKLQIRNPGWLTAPLNHTTMEFDPVVAPSFLVPIDIRISTGPVTIDTNTLKLTATEFLPYSTKSGAPVYDTVTGAQLNDPFS